METAELSRAELLELCRRLANACDPPPAWLPILDKLDENELWRMAIIIGERADCSKALPGDIAIVEKWILKHVVPVLQAKSQAQAKGTAPRKPGRRKALASEVSEEERLRLETAARNINDQLQLENPIPIGPEMDAAAYKDAIIQVAGEILPEDPLRNDTKKVLSELGCGPTKWTETISPFHKKFTKAFAARWTPHIKGNNMAVFLAVMFNDDFNDGGRKNTISNEDISKFTGIPYNKVDKHTGELKELGLLSNAKISYKRRNKGRPTTVNHWTIHWDADPPLKD